jgi:ubiquinone/menaquinone biosynthesis C-methylase UbiE
VGIFAHLISRGGISAIGFDLNLQLVSQAAVKNAPEGRFFVASIEEMPFSNASLEAVVIADVIEHLCNPSAAFEEIARVLAPGGMAVLTIPNPNFERVCNLFRLSQADIGHQRTYSREELEQIIGGISLQIVVHQYVCNVGVAMADAAVAKLAILKYGKEAVQRSEMALKTSSLGLVARCYYLACKLSYPVLRMLECIIPSALGTENLLVLFRASQGRQGR